MCNIQINDRILNLLLGIFWVNRGKLYLLYALYHVNLVYLDFYNY